MDLTKIIENLINQKHEKEWFEFKVNWFIPSQLGEYISALSNAAALQGEDYGFFVWGIENNTHKVVGTSFDYDCDVKNEPLKHYLARQIIPDIGFQFKELTFREKRLVVLIIPAAAKMPTAFDEVRYIRIGSSKEKLMKYPDYESRLFQILRNGYPTIANTESEYQDLTFNKMFLFFETKGVSLNRKTFKKNLGLLTESGKYNVLAQLLSDDSHIPIQFANFARKTKTSPMYSVKEFGYSCILFSLDQVLDYGKLLNIPQADERNRETVRKEVPLFNNNAYEEAVINAFVHNRWLDGNAPMFTAYQDRIEILSRGNLPPKQTIEGFYEGESVPVNEALSRIFIMLHITEHTGRGVPRITGIYGRDTITFKENSITVTIPYDRLGSEVYAQDTSGNVQDGSTINPVNTHDTPVNTHDDGQNTPVNHGNTPVNSGITPDNTPVNRENISVNNSVLNIEDRILIFCSSPKGILEIAVYLGFKEKKTVRKYLKPLVDLGRIAMTIPDKPNSRNQKYITIK